MGYDEEQRAESELISTPSRASRACCDSESQVQAECFVARSLVMTVIRRLEVMPETYYCGQTAKWKEIMMEQGTRAVM